MKFINLIHVKFPPRLIFLGQIRHFLRKNRGCLGKIRMNAKILWAKTGYGRRKKAKKALQTGSGAGINLTLVQLNLHSYERQRGCWAAFCVPAGTENGYVFVLLVAK
jgi:hypothetical protein